MSPAEDVDPPVAGSSSLTDAEKNDKSSSLHSAASVPLPVADSMEVDASKGTFVVWLLTLLLVADHLPGWWGMGLGGVGVKMSLSRTSESPENRC